MLLLQLCELTSNEEQCEIRAWDVGDLVTELHHAEAAAHTGKELPMCSTHLLEQHC